MLFFKNRQAAKIAKSTAVKEFTRIDWYGFSGCIGWESPSQEPLKRYWNLAEPAMEFEIIADSQAIQAFGMSEDDDEPKTWEINLTFPNQQSARLWLEALPDDLTIEYLESLGFTEL